MKRLIAAIIVLGAACNAHPVLAQKDYRFSRQQAEDYAVEHGYVARKQQLEVKKKDQEVREVLGKGYPQIDASGQFQQYLDVPVQVIPDFISPVIQQNLVSYGLIDESETSGGRDGFVAAQFGTEFNATGKVEAQQLIFNGSYFVGIQAAKAVKQLSKNTYKKTEQQVREMVEKAYHTALVARRSVEILKDNIKSLEKTQKETQALYENGFLEEQDAQQVRVNLLNLRNSLNYSKRNADIARKMLKFQMGLKIEDEIELTDDIETLVLAASDSTLAQRDAELTTHPDYLLAQSNLQIAELSLKNNKTGYLPNLNAFFSYQQNARRNEFNFFNDGEWYPTTVWGLNLSLPIFTGFQRDAKVQQGRIDVDKAHINLEQTDEKLRVQLDRARSEFEYARKNYSNRTKNLNLAESIRDKTRIKYREGVSGSSDLNVAERQYLDAQNTYNQSALELLNKKVELDAALNKILEQ